MKHLFLGNIKLQNGAADRDEKPKGDESKPPIKPTDAADSADKGKKDTFTKAEVEEMIKKRLGERKSVEEEAKLAGEKAKEEILKGLGKSLGFIKDEDDEKLSLKALEKKLTESQAATLEELKKLRQEKALSDLKLEATELGVDPKKRDKAIKYFLRDLEEVAEGGKKPTLEEWLEENPEFKGLAKDDDSDPLPLRRGGSEGVKRAEPNKPGHVARFLEKRKAAGKEKN